MSVHEFHSSDPESEKNRREYHDLLENIKRRMDPGSNTVLIIDDEVGIRRRVARDIRKMDPGIVVFEAGNGQEGLEQLAAIREQYEKDPLFIVLDLNMPIMTGWEFIDALKKECDAARRQGPPVIVLSSTTGEKGIPLFRKSVHKGKSGYSPLVTVAKEVCVDPARYDAFGEKGLVGWIQYFVKSGLQQ